MQIMNLFHHFVLVLEPDTPFAGIDVSILKSKMTKKTLESFQKYNCFLITGKIEDDVDIVLLSKNIIKVYWYFQEHKKEIGLLQEENRIIASIQAGNLNNGDIEKLKQLFLALSCENTEERCRYIYDVACNEFDKKFENNRICQFEENRCICQREEKVRFKKDGCCHAFHYRDFDKMPVYTGDCPFLSENGCSTKCLGCKIFTCAYLKKRKIVFHAKDCYLLNVFLNPKLLKYSESTYFKTEDEIIEYWLKNNVGVI